MHTQTIEREASPYCKQWKTGRGLVTRLHGRYLAQKSPSPLCKLCAVRNDGLEWGTPSRSSKDLLVFKVGRVHLFSLSSSSSSLLLLLLLPLPPLPPPPLPPSPPLFLPPLHPRLKWSTPWQKCALPWQGQVTLVSLMDPLSMFSSRSQEVCVWGLRGRHSSLLTLTTMQSESWTWTPVRWLRWVLCFNSIPVYLVPFHCYL